MLEFNEAKRILKYYGFISESIEPKLCKKDGNVGIFVTFKTKYGHLSRFIVFKSGKSLEDFLKIYLWYRKEINNDSVLVEFDDYEKLTPKIKFMSNGKEINNNFNKNEILEDTIEQLIVDTTHEENLALLNVIYTKIKCFIQEVKELEADLINVISNYLDNLIDYLDLIESDEEVEAIKINSMEYKKYENKINKILINFKNDSDENFQNYLNAAIGIYNEILLDADYEHNLYLLEFYKEEIKKLATKTDFYNKYISEKEKNSKSLKKKNITDFFDYLEKNYSNSNTVNKDTVLNKKNKEAENMLDELLNSSSEELKIRYNIIEESDDRTVDLEQKEVLGTEELNKYELQEYYKNLSFREKTINILLSSPIKELINIVINISKKDKVSIILNEKHYSKIFEEVYEILSNDDNFAISRKYLKPIKLDSLEEFISSVVNVANSIHNNTFKMPIDTTLKYKIGVYLDNGYINASILNNYPVNNRGLNNYCISNTNVEIPVYYANFILKINEEDNVLKVINNDNIVTFDMKGLKINNKEELKVNNYILKIVKNKKQIEYNFVLFNKKIYVTSNLDRNGDKNGQE